jgi:tetratricopeptide (TPR) repeat protein
MSRETLKRMSLAWLFFALMVSGHDSARAQNAERTAALVTEAVELLEQGDLGAAEVRLTSALELDKLHVGANTTLGKLKLLRGEPREAQQYANVALSKERNHAEALILLVRAQEGPDQVASILKRIEELANMLRDDPGVQLAHAEALLAAKKFEPAQAAATRVLKMRETSVAAMKVLARTYLGLERPVTAESILLRALEFERDAEALCMLAGIRYAEKNVIEARLLVEEAVGASPSFVEGLNSLGAIYAVVRNWEGAVDVLNRAIALAPKFAEAWLNLGVAQRGAGDFEQAEASWKRVLALSPAMGDAWYNLGVLYLENPIEGRDRIKQLTDAINALNAYKEKVGNSDANADKFIEEAKILIKQEEERRTEQLKPPPGDGGGDGSNGDGGDGSNGDGGDGSNGDDSNDGGDGG